MEIFLHEIVCGNSRKGLFRAGGCQRAPALPRSVLVPFPLVFGAGWRSHLGLETALHRLNGNVAVNGQALSDSPCSG